MAKDHVNLPFAARLRVYNWMRERNGEFVRDRPQISDVARRASKELGLKIGSTTITSVLAAGVEAGEMKSWRRITSGVGASRMWDIFRRLGRRLDRIEQQLKLEPLPMLEGELDPPGVDGFEDGDDEEV